MTEDFSDIAPYPDEELTQRLQAFCGDPELLEALIGLRFNHLPQFTKPFLKFLIRAFLMQKIGKVESRADWHNVIVNYIELMLRETSDGFSYSGTEALPQDTPCLYISNHRDIALDPVLINYALWLNGLRTCQIAVGDNLMTLRFGTEFMRINNSFIVVRNANGMRAQYAALNKTSRYIRNVLAQGESVWIAHREGRSKDGTDQTDPAVLKMFALAYRDESDDPNYILEKINLVPTTISYETDPNGIRKAHELAERERHGSYEKSEHEDRDSLVLGLTGFKGRIHVAFDPPIKGGFRDFDEFALAIDTSILANRKPFGTYLAAQELLAGREPELPPGKVKETFTQQWQQLEGRERELLLAQYANQAFQSAGN